MQLSFVVFGLALLVAVLVKTGDATASRDELLDDLTEELLVRYLERRKLDINARHYYPPVDGSNNYPPVESSNGGGRYNNGPVRRWWGGSHSSTSNSQNAQNNGNINNNRINGQLSAGSIIGSSQGRK